MTNDLREKGKSRTKKSTTSPSPTSKSERRENLKRLPE